MISRERIIGTPDAIRVPKVREKRETLIFSARSPKMGSFQLELVDLVAALGRLAVLLEADERADDRSAGPATRT